MFQPDKELFQFNEHLEKLRPYHYNCKEMKVYSIYSGGPCVDIGVFKIDTNSKSMFLDHNIYCDENQWIYN